MNVEKIMDELRAQHKAPRGLAVPRPLQVMAMGAGVQSSCEGLMAAHGEIEAPDFALFADTGDESEATYKWLSWLEKQLPFPIIRVHRFTPHRSITDESFTIHTSGKSGLPYIKGLVPAITLAPNGDKGIFGRKCTADWKLQPQMAFVRKMVTVKRGQTDPSAVFWIGISTDEGHRMKPARRTWAKNRFPLIEKRMSRKDCERWMSDHGYPQAPRSACVFCPFHSDEEWLGLKEGQPKDFARAVKYERDLQEATLKVPRLTSVPYLNKRCVPLDTIDFSAPTGDPDQLDMFAGDCEGLCGV